jgi:hypothetical protein
MSVIVKRKCLSAERPGFQITEGALQGVTHPVLELSHHMLEMMVETVKEGTAAGEEQEGDLDGLHQMYPLMS